MLCYYFYPCCLADGLNGVFAKDWRLLHQALQADPLTGALLAQPQIREMVNELLSENALYLSEWP